MTPHATNPWVLIAGASGLLAVVCGTFGAHGLEGVLGTRDLETWHTAVQYQMFHTLAMLGVAVLHGQRPRGAFRVAGVFFLLGIAAFCGSLYVLAVSEWMWGERMRWLGMVAPVGGLCFMIGWVATMFGAMATGRPPKSAAS